MAPSMRSLIPPQPEQIFDLNIDPDIVANLILKELYVKRKCIPRQIAKNLMVSPEVIEKLIADLKKQELVGMVGGTGMGSDYQYGLYPKGQERAKQLFDRDSYLGPAPVGFDEYIRVTKDVLAFNKKNFSVSQKTMVEKFAHHLGYQDVLIQIGQAVCARKPAFVYGFPGNGKTFLCSAVVKLLPAMIVPYAVDVGNQLVRIFDPSCHEVLTDCDMDGLDGRWVAIKAPMITAGGELTLEDLEVVYNSKFGCFDAPPQVKATGGVLLIDDLGRQRCGVDQIFNRLIIPLENRVDYLVLGGQRMEVPTDEIVLFSTNLDPKKIVDDAFLRRLPYKINVRNPDLQEYIAIWDATANKLGLQSSSADVEYLVTLYRRDQRGLRAVHPRDLLTIIFDRKRFFEDGNTSVSPQEIDEAYRIYFVSELTMIETQV